jgi:multiple sugar transport system substrate-binding protein
MNNHPSQILHLKSSLLFIFILTVLCLSCGGGKKDAGEETGPVTLTYWQTYNDDENALFSKLAEEYQADHPGVTIQATRLPFMGAEPKILTALATRTTPDIARVDGSFVPKLATRHALIDLDKLGLGDIKQDLLPVALSSCVVAGSTYALPEQVNGLCLFYNKELFRQAGLDPEDPPDTWAEFISVGKKLTNPEKGIYGFGMRNSLWWTFPFFNTYGAPFLNKDGTRCVLNGPKGVEAFQLKVDLYRKYKIEGGGWRAGGVRDDMGFQNGKYAMIFSGPWAVKTLESAGIDFGVGLIPRGPAGTSTNVGGNDLVIFRSCQHPKRALQFLKFMASEAVQTQWCNELGQVPVNVKAEGHLDFERHPYLRVFVEQMKTAIPRPPIADYDELENIMNPEMQAALDGTKSVQKALDDAVRRINREVLGSSD